MTTTATPLQTEKQRKIQSFIDDIDSFFDSIYQEKREKFEREFNFDLDKEE